MTEKLYYLDPYQTEFTTRLEGQEQIDTPDGPRWQVRLSATCFYPEGGGQPSDRGTLNDRIIADVRKEGTDVIHILEAPLDTAAGEVFGRIEPLHRRHYMQQHTGQHIISAVLQQRCGRATRSVHLGENYTAIEIEGNSLTPFEIIEVEDEVNRIICENRPVHGFFPDPDELKQLSLRRSLKAEQNIRLVEVSGLDLIGCGGVHLGRTGEVRLVKHISSEKVRGNCRLHFVIGDNAMADYREKSRIASRLVDLLSAPQGELTPALDDFLEKSSDRDRVLSDTLKERNRLLAARLYNEASAKTASPVVTVELGNEYADQLRQIAEELAVIDSQGSLRGAVVAATRDDGTVRWVIFLPENSPLGFNRIKAEALPLIDGKGGGRPPFFQGAGRNTAGTDRFLKTFAELAGEPDPA